MPSSSDPPPDASNPLWFRPPTPRERIIAFLLFCGFALFFFLLFLLLAGRCFRWLLLALAAISLLHALSHARAAARSSTHHQHRNESDEQ